MPTIDQHERRICYASMGDPSDPCIIFIEGISGQLINWPAAITQALADRGFYVITFDNRDMGLSSYYDHLEAPSIEEALSHLQSDPTYRPPYGLDDMAEDIIVLMDGLNVDQAHIVGISMGGMIAQVLACEYPDRVLSVNLIATSSKDPGLPPPQPEVMAFFSAASDPEQTVETAIQQHLQQYQLYNPHEVIDEEAIRKHFHVAYERAHHPMGFQRQLLAMMFAKGMGEALQKLSIPSLIIHGDADPVVPIEHAHQLQECLQGSILEIISKMGHGTPEQHRERIGALIEKNIRRSLSEDRYSSRP